MKGSFEKYFIFFIALILLSFTQSLLGWSDPNLFSNRESNSLTKPYNTTILLSEKEEYSNSQKYVRPGFFENNISRALIICNIVLVFVTIYYAMCTKHISESNQKVVNIMEKELELSLRPFIQIGTYIIPGNRMICLKISNVGKSAAEKLRLKIDKDFYQYGSKKEIHNLKLAYVFNNEIEIFAPSSELLFYIGFGHQIYDENTDQNLTPPNFTITAKYKFFEKEFVEKTTIDLQIYRKTQLPPQEAIVTQLKEIKSAIDKLNR